MGQIGVDLEQPGVADQALVLELGNDGVHIVLFADLHSDFLVVTAEGQHVGGADPHEAAQGDADEEDHGQPHGGSQDLGQAEEVIVLLALGTALGGGTVLGLGLGSGLGGSFAGFLDNAGGLCGGRNVLLTGLVHERRDVGRNLVFIHFFGIGGVRHSVSSCQRMTICAAMRWASSSPFSTSIRDRPKGMAQPAEVPVMRFSSVTAAASSIMMALPMPPSQPG